jgi:pentose-5-phosphate-3-epimerase
MTLNPAFGGQKFIPNSIPKLRECTQSGKLKTEVGKIKMGSVIKS